MIASILEDMYSKNTTMSIFDTITNAYFKIIFPLAFLIFIGGSLISDSFGIYLFPAFMVGSFMVFLLLIFGMIVSL